MPRRPRVYFEEWYDPLISGIGWVGELIEIAGGENIFPDVKGNSARECIISAEEVERRNPDMIIASWCGKKVDMQNIYNRPSWDKIEAIKNQRVYEIKSMHILQPGPAILEGLRQIHQIIQQGFA